MIPGLLFSLLAWIASAFFTPPPVPPIHLPLPARLVPQVERTIGEAVSGAYLLGVENGIALGAILGIAGAFLTLAGVRALLALSAFLRSGARFLDSRSLPP